MSTSFPTSLDTYTVKNSGDTLQPAHVNDIQDAVSALEAKVGVDGSSVATSHTKKIADMLTVLGSCTTADLQKLHDLTATALELNIMDGVTATTAELNKLDADNLTTGDLLTKGASAIEVISAVAATQYLKSAGTSTKPAYGKLALRDTGVTAGSAIASPGNRTVTLGYRPSAVIFLGWADGFGFSVGIHDGTNTAYIGHTDSSNQWAGSGGSSRNVLSLSGEAFYVNNVAFLDTGFSYSTAGPFNYIFYLALP